MNLNMSLKQPYIRARILGTILIVLGVVMIITNNNFYIKIGISSLLIGLFMIFIITEKTIPENISNAQIEGHQNAFKTITQNLNLNGKAVFLPTNHIRNEERIFIPLDDKTTNIPDDNLVFSTGMDGKSLGISLPPSGLKLLPQIENNFEHTNIENVEEKLQTFVGMDLLKSVALKQKPDGWKLELEKPLFCNHDSLICKQYPCPTCSAVLTAITRATNKKIMIHDAVHNGKKTTFELKIGE